MEEIKSLLKDIQLRKFIIQSQQIKNNKTVCISSHDVVKIKNDERFNITKDWLIQKYIVEEYSRNALVKDYGLEISSSVFKKAFEIFNIPRRILGQVTKRTSKLRSLKAKKEHETKTGWWKETVVRQNSGCERGIQGYYFNQSKQKYVWLRSSYEYIYAKWLDKNKIDWDVECKRFEVAGKLYKPDFFIFEEGKLVKIVEIKGYWNNGTWKDLELNKVLDVEVIIITKEEIINYTTNYENTERKQWKKNRLLKLE